MPNNLIDIAKTVLEEDAESLAAAYAMDLARALIAAEALEKAVLAEAEARNSYHEAPTNKRKALWLAWVCSRDEIAAKAAAFRAAVEGKG
jgi:hypothetical protein